MYDPRSREKKAYEERMRLTTYKPKAIEYITKAEAAGSTEVGLYFAQIAQVYATLENARVSGSRQNGGNK